TLTPRQAGKSVVRVTVTAAGAAAVRDERSVQVEQARLALEVRGPAQASVGQVITWDVRVVNQGKVAVTDVVVQGRLPPEVGQAQAADGGLVVGGAVSWNLGVLPPGGMKRVRVTARAERQVRETALRVVATGAGGLREEASAPLTIGPAVELVVRVRPEGAAVAVGKRLKYTVEVANTGALPAAQVEVRAVLPPELRPLLADGPTR